MKKLVIGAITGAVILGGAATYTFADSNDDNRGFYNDMRPFMEEMHPNFSDEDYEAMYDFCHGNGNFEKGPHRGNDFDRNNE
ncbi:hypothetical protein J32TS6_11540 [Virgibacillus pantothenticus]|uniref:hypothetical protein n=1 Tax=Virgibacillus TaxID=84406 RepID=UPI00090A9DD5|nr:MULTISPECIES: hypothetical protein [Virgibacillus]API93256.1 hypothetical protein BKP57_16405 [Virgibacillus sp. 6R]MBS7428698.1 hypothetical protein [Virgibacillus sp. 19R1-5]MBU8565773.1 hypothetical protein [Virgibacillus pantothenticus]MBU8599640.1 hypothetical protein [Virgibacillus pantothenticus]MBU8634087.1 hypothetical protein [Virgibacillus pantothenticus]